MVTMIPIVTSALGKASKGLERRLEELEIDGRIGIIQPIAFLKSAKILRSVLEIWGYLQSHILKKNTI